MDKLAAYEMLLEDHPLWSEKGASAERDRILLQDAKLAKERQRLRALEAGDRLPPSEKMKLFALMTGGMGLAGAGAAAATKKDIPAGLAGGLTLGALSSALGNYVGNRRNRRRDELRSKGLY